MIGAVLTMIGDFLLLGVDSAGATGSLGQYILAAEKISYTRIGLACSNMSLGALIIFLVWILLLRKQ